jgi:hypothetical protein
MLKNAIEILKGVGREQYQHNGGSVSCRLQYDYPGVLLDESRAGRNEDIYRATLEAMQKAQPGEVTVVRSHYSYKNNESKLIGYTTHYFRFPRKD